MCEPNVWSKFGARKTTNKILFMKYLDKFVTKSIEFVITDMKKVWFQLVFLSELVKVSEISSEKEPFLEHLFKAVESQDSELNFKETTGPAKDLPIDDEPNLVLIGYFGGLATSFKFHMIEMPDGVYKHITLPFLLLLQHGEKEKAFMIKQLKAKDDEIQEWRATNATIARGSLKTEPFSELETIVPLVVPADAAHQSAKIFESIAGYAVTCTQMSQLHLFDDVVVKTETETPTISEVNTEAGPSTASFPAVNKDEAPSTQSEQTPQVDPQKKVKPEKRTTVPSKSQAGKKTKTNQRLI